MKNEEINAPLFRQAVELIAAGDIEKLSWLVAHNPYLVTDRLITNEEGYFNNPYLLWFVADNPIRVGKLSQNIADTCYLLIKAVKQYAPETFQLQLDYALGLVATGRIPRECGVQIALMDVLIDAGAKPGGGIGALANGNIEAAEHLLKHGGEMSLTLAVGLDRVEEIDQLLRSASDNEKIRALTAAAFLGKATLVAKLLQSGVNPNGYPQQGDGFHSHATPLHQAVSSGSLDAVKLLVDAGAKLDAVDKIYNGTPLEWAQYMQQEEADEQKRSNLKHIEEYLITKCE